MIQQMNCHFELSTNGRLCFTTNRWYLTAPRPEFWIGAKPCSASTMDTDGSHQLFSEHLSTFSSTNLECIGCRFEWSLRGKTWARSLQPFEFVCRKDQIVLNEFEKRFRHRYCSSFKLQFNDIFWSFCWIDDAPPRPSTCSEILSLHLTPTPLAHPHHKLRVDRQNF